MVNASGHALFVQHGRVNVTFVPEHGVEQAPTVALEGTPVPQAVEYLRAVLAAQGWADELEHAPYAAHHGMGLAAINMLEAGIAPVVVPVQFGCYVAT